jgi:AbrB family looped-hinge helix DNA binding protein
MHYTTTLSSKGQIVIPKQIRVSLDLKASDELIVDSDGENIIVKPAITSDDVFGMFKPKKVITKKDIKKAYAEAVRKKHGVQ